MTANAANAPACGGDAAAEHVNWTPCWSDFSTGTSITCQRRINGDSANFWSFPTPIFMATLCGGMKRPILQLPDSSSESARFRPTPSKLLRFWWWFLHGLAGLAVAVSSLQLWWKCLVVAGVLAHARWRRVSAVPDFDLVRPGCRPAPGPNRNEFVLTARSRYGRWWLRLALEDPGRTLEWTLYFDQLPQSDWRTLAREVRKAAGGAAKIGVRMRSEPGNR